MRGMLLLSKCLVVVVLALPGGHAEGRERFADRAWWVTYVAPGIYTSGLLSERDILSAKESGFKTILSVWGITPSFADSKPWPGEAGAAREDRYGLPGKFRIPDKEAEYVRGLGMAYLHVQPWCPTASDGGCESGVQHEITAFLTASPKPILVHCQVSFLATASARFHLYRVGGVSPSSFYRTSAGDVAWDYAPTYSKQWEVLTGYAARGDDAYPTLHPALPCYRCYWRSQRVADWVYTAGQVERGHYLSVAKAGFKAVVNVRRDGDGGLDGVEYFSPGGVYREDLEREEVEQAGLQYFYAPWGSADTVLDSIRAAREVGTVLVKSRAGWDAVAAAVLAVTKEKGGSAFEAAQLARARGGWLFTDESSEPFRTFAQVLGDGCAGGSASGGAGWWAVLVWLNAAALVALGVWCLARRGDRTVAPSPTTNPLPAKPPQPPTVRTTASLLVAGGLAVALGLLSFFMGEKADGPADIATRKVVEPVQSVGDGEGRAVFTLENAGEAGVEWETGLRSFALYLIGGYLGVVMQRGDFAFSGTLRRALQRGVRPPDVNREVRSLVLLLLLTSLAFAPVLSLGEASVRGVAVRGWVNPIDLPLAVGSTVFGVGAQLADGCGSGCANDAAQGNWRSLIALFSFVIGSALGGWAFEGWQDWPRSDGVSLLADMPRGAGLLVQLAFLTALYGALLHLGDPSDDPSSPPTQHPILAQYRVAQRRSEGGLLPDSLHSFLFAPLSPEGCAAGLAVGNLLILITRGRPWGITGAYSTWGANLFRGLGADVESWDYYRGGVERNIFADDGTTAIVLGMLAGGLLAAVVSTGRFFTFKASSIPRAAASAVVGGLLLGLGARLSRGCNIGAFLSGVASFSLAPWIWIIGCLVGTAISAPLRPYLGFCQECPSCPDALHDEAL
eukprot:Sspe_Gene.73221::Locus_44047_Transcript_1_1_Confidence_1.000_Length_2873::g.73221::m.73221/K07112/K07112; uncharacterized protein